MSQPLKVLVTGAAGQIAYSLVISIAKGDVFGENQPIDLMMLDILPMETVLKGVALELQDCALKTLNSVVATTDEKEAFTDIDVACLVGAMPRREGMERKDLLAANVKIFQSQGKALDQYSKKTVKVVVVGNPANTNAFICSHFAPSIPKENFSCLTRLDQNRAQSQIALRLGIANENVSNCIIWGNHSSTQFPDISQAKAIIDNKTCDVTTAVGDDDWLKNEFISTVQKRGATIIAMRKLSSALSAAKAICDHLRDWWFGTKPGCFTSMGVIAGESVYGIPGDLMYSFPVTIHKDRTWTIVKDIEINDFAREKMEITKKELEDEKAIALEACK